MFILKRIFPVVLTFAVLGYTIYFSEPPGNWQQASILQILIFFIPLLLFFTFLADLFFNYLVRSFTLGLGIMMLIVLKSVDQLNIVTGAITIITTLLLISVFKKPSPSRNPLNGKFKNLFKNR